MPRKRKKDATPSNVAVVDADQDDLLIEEGIKEDDIVEDSDAELAAVESEVAEEAEPKETVPTAKAVEHLHAHTERKRSY